MSASNKYGRIRAENQLVFLGTGQLFGVQSIDVPYNVGLTPLNYLGIGSKQLVQVQGQEQFADVSIGSVMMNSDPFIDLTGVTQPINMFILQNQNDIVNNFSLLSGYLTAYSCRYAISQPVETTAQIRFYNVGQMNLSGLDGYSLSQLETIQTGIYVNTAQEYLFPYGGSIQLQLNEYQNNRIIDFDINIRVNRVPIYNVGERFPNRIDILYPITVNCSFSFEVGNYSGTRLQDLPANQQTQNITLTLSDYLSNTPIKTYNFPNMTMVNESMNTTTNTSVTVKKEYVGFFFYRTPEIVIIDYLDFGNIVDAPTFSQNCGTLSSFVTVTEDWGSIA